MHPSSGQRNKFRGAESDDGLLALSASSSKVSCSSTSEVALSTRLNLIEAKFTNKRWYILFIGNIKLSPRNELTRVNVVSPPYSQTLLTVLNVADEDHPIPFHRLCDCL